MSARKSRASAAPAAEPETQPAAPAPFEIKDCALITRMGGVDPAINLRELRERMLQCPESCLYHHF